MRRRHEDRTGVVYNIGDVIQHRTDGWRGIVLGWDRIDNASESSSSISSSEDDDDDDDDEERPATYIKYDVLPDNSDWLWMLGGNAPNMLHLLDSSLTEFNVLTGERASLLGRVSNNMVNNYFTRFDDTTGRFIPTEMLQFNYPLDTITAANAIEEQSSEEEKAREYAAHATTAVNLINDLNGKVSSVIEESMMSASEATKQRQPLRRYVNSLQKIINISKGAAIIESQPTTTTTTTTATTTEAGQFVRKRKESDKQHQSRTTAESEASEKLNELISLHRDITDTTVTRKVALEAVAAREMTERGEDPVLLPTPPMKFKVGTVVKHKVYGFRGHITGFDSQPRFNVDNWDGLVDIENKRQPFYTIVPDFNDSIAEFGPHYRHTRYVIEENLEVCPDNELSDFSPVFMDDAYVFDEEFKSKWKPNAELLWRYGHDQLEDTAEGASDKELDAAVDQIQSSLRTLLCEARKVKENNGDDIVDGFHVDALLSLLKQSTSVEKSTAFEDTIRAACAAHEKPEVEMMLRSGIACLNRMQWNEALVNFNDAIAVDPTYSEAWNRKATALFNVGADESEEANKEGREMALEASDEALKSNPEHFSALFNRGLALKTEGRYEEAANAFRECLRIHPFSKAATSLIQMEKKQNMGGMKKKGSSLSSAAAGRAEWVDGSLKPKTDTKKE
jgi:hemimethylated DNA binding protein